MRVKSESRSVLSDSLRPHGLYSPWNSPSLNTGVGSLSLFQGIFPTQGSNPGLPRCRRILYQLKSQGKPKNTGVCSLSLLQGIFPAQESNQGLPHCRQTLYQLSYHKDKLIEIAWRGEWDEELPGTSLQERQSQVLIRPRDQWDPCSLWSGINLSTQPIMENPDSERQREKTALGR